MKMRGVFLLWLLVLVVTATAGQKCEKRLRLPGVQMVPNSQCDCMPSYLCLNPNENQADFQFDPRAPLACSEQLEVCCPKENQIIPDTGPNGGKKVTPPLMPYEGCGRRNRKGVGINMKNPVGGTAQFGEFPWTAALLTEENGQLTLIGGGALISPSVVLTAAHTVVRYTTKPSSLSARLGEWDTQATSILLPPQTLTVREIIIHENFTMSNFHNDIALLVLSDNVAEANNVGTVCLPEQDAVIDSSECLATGWGKDVFGCYQAVLKSINFPTVTSSLCQTQLQKSRAGPRFRLDSSFICAGGKESVDVCVGDGGAPLACPIPGDDKFYQQAGIISWGIGCGLRDVPGVYTNVAKFRYWIDDKFAERRLLNSFYTRA